MKRALARSVVSFLCLAFVPAAAYAQASFTGIVKDTSGAVLPGVNVEASSAVLIEKSRSAVTDGEGRYIIQDLRPWHLSSGVYASRVQDRRPREPRTSRHQRRDRQRGHGDWHGRRDHHRLGRHADGGPAEHDAAGLDHSGDRLEPSELAESIRARRADCRRQTGLRRPRRRRRGRRGSGVTGRQRRPDRRPAHDGERRGAQLRHRRRLGRRCGAERVRNGGVRHRRLGRRCAGRDRRRARQLHPARRRQPVLPARSPAAIAKDSFAADNYTGTDVQQRGLAAPSTIKGNGEFNPGVGGPLKRDKLWFFVSGKYVFADNFVGGHVLQREREQAERVALRALDPAGDPASGPADLPGAAHVSG